MKLEDSIKIEKIVKKVIKENPDKDRDYLVDIASEQAKELIDLTDKQKLTDWVLDNIPLIRRAIKEGWGPGLRILRSIEELWFEQIRGYVIAEVEDLMEVKDV